MRPVIDALQKEPRPPGAEKIAGTLRAFRIRIGSYRVIYEIHDSVLLVLVIDMGHRREDYRQH
jgi:mRNA interferase RelE/StbE